MALTERTEEQLEILHNGVIQVRETTVILRDGVEISRTHHRKVVDVDDDVTGESQRLKDISSAVWTAKVKSDRAAERAASESSL